MTINEAASILFLIFAFVFLNIKDTNLLIWSMGLAVLCRVESVRA